MFSTKSRTLHVDRGTVLDRYVLRDRNSLSLDPGWYLRPYYPPTGSLSWRGVTLDCKALIGGGVHVDGETHTERTQEKGYENLLQSVSYTLESEPTFSSWDTLITIKPIVVLVKFRETENNPPFWSVSPRFLLVHRFLCLGQLRARSPRYGSGRGGGTRLSQGVFDCHRTYTSAGESVSGQSCDPSECVPPKGTYPQVSP